MTDHLILDFPVLQQASGDFVADVSYEIEASRSAKELTITHTLKGQSFVQQLIKNSDAVFSVLLLYKGSSERQFCKTADISANNNAIVAKQIIAIDFSYAPEISPSIFTLQEKKITVNNTSGLTDFWKQGDSFKIPQHSRIALSSKLQFTSGDVSKLLRIVWDKKFNDGEMKVEVNEYAGEGETPVTLLCGKGVYDQLHKVNKAEPKTAAESMRSAIVTQALCAVYAHMKEYTTRDDPDPVGGVLSAHLEMLKEKTGESWDDDDTFDPSLAATKMQPYAIKPLHNE